MKKNEIQLTPSTDGADCIGNGEHEEVECQCDECEHFLECFPNWRLMMKGAEE